MIMRCKKRFRANLLRIRDIFQHRPRDGKPIKCACASPDFIQNQQAFVRCVMQNVRNLCHFHHKRALPCGKVIRCTDTGEDSVYNADMRLLRGNEAANLRHQHNQRGLPHICRFPCHIRACDDGKSGVLPI